MVSRKVRRVRLCAGADRPAHRGPQIQDSPAAFLESWGGIAHATLSIWARFYGSILSGGEGGNALADTMQTRGFFEDFRFSAK